MEIGLFPLGLVLLPTERIPLHIFEPRYRELIGECLEEEAPFGLVYADDEGHPAVGTLRDRDRGDRALRRRPAEHRRRGGERFRLVDADRRAQLPHRHDRAVDDVHDPPAGADVERALALFRASSS